MNGSLKAKPGLPGTVKETACANIEAGRYQLGNPNGPEAQIDGQLGRGCLTDVWILFFEHWESVDDRFCSGVKLVRRSTAEP